MKKSNILKNISYIFIILIISLVASFYLTKQFSNKISKSIYSYAESETKRLITTIINTSISKQNLNYDESDLYEIIKNDNNEIQLINFNTPKVTNLLNKITSLIEDNIESINTNQEILNNISENHKITRAKDGLIYELPIGMVTGNIFLSNLGTKIPLKLQIIGDVISEIDSTVTEYGLNNALIKIEIKITINTRIIAPFTTKEMTLTNKVPLSLKVIQGTVPNYYLPTKTN